MTATNVWPQVSFIVRFLSAAGILGNQEFRDTSAHRGFEEQGLPLSHMVARHACEQNQGASEELRPCINDVDKVYVGGEVRQQTLAKRTASIVV